MTSPSSPTIEAAAYRAPWWLPGQHAQTILPFLQAPALPALVRERWDTPDGDFIDLDWLPTAAESPVKSSVSGPEPLLVIFHGLEGSSRSHYARALLVALAQQGWRGVVPHFRGCSGELNRLPRFYHSGDSAEIDWIVRRLHRQEPSRPLLLAGFSLGGNALLKWLGEVGEEANRLVLAAVAVCPPLDLTVVAPALGRGFNRLYSQRFLATLKPKALAKIARHGGNFDRQRIARSRSFFDFDDAYTAPLHGFKDAFDYWRRASARPWLAAITCPTMVVVADNDPFVPPAAWPLPSQCSDQLAFSVTKGGGHIGFMTGALPGRIDWLARYLIAYFKQFF